MDNFTLNTQQDSWQNWTVGTKDRTQYWSVLKNETAEPEQMCLKRVFDDDDIQQFLCQHENF